MPPISPIPNARVSAVLSPFAFLIGDWTCEAKVLAPSGDWQSFPAIWIGRVVLDGSAIADEYRMTSPSGDLLVLGMNFRTFDTTKQALRIQWLNALDGTWTDLASEEFGGVRFDGSSITYAFREPMAAHPYSRATYTVVSPTHFTWRGEKSTDAHSWSEFMKVECDRAEKAALIPAL